jgi:plasmid maintenance system antidote protein VapI
MAGKGDLIELLRQEVAATSQTEFARKAGVQQSLISNILHGKERIGPKVAKALGYHRVITWEPLQDISNGL